MRSPNAYSYVWFLHGQVEMTQSIILSNPLLFMWAVHAFLCQFLLLQLASQSVLFLCSGVPGLLNIRQYQRVEELRCLCPHRLICQPNLHFWPWEVDGGADGHICKPVSQISSGIAHVAKHNSLHPACYHLKHWKVTHLTCHIFFFHLTEPCIKQTHTRSVCLYWYQTNMKRLFR